MIDTHCHISFDAYDDDRADVLQRAKDVGVTRIIHPATDLDDSREGIRLAAAYDGIYVAVGIHPNSTANFQAEQIEQIEKMASAPRVVAIGEIGLDYYWDKSPKDLQEKAFKSQLELAAQLEMPVIIHNREASHDIMPILETWAQNIPKSLQGRAGVLHSFSASADIAKRAIDAGFYLGFTGPITFKKSDELRRIAAIVPINRIVVETDGPFLTPHPYRGKRNEPSHIPLIVERLAGLHQISIEQMAQHTTSNAEKLFNLPQ